MIHFVQLFNLERKFLCLSGLTLKFRIGERFFQKYLGPLTLTPMVHKVR